MFNTAIIKNRKRGGKVKKIEARADVLEVTSQGRVIPYFEIVPEQAKTDERYLKLSRADQGDFWRLMLLLWRDGGAHLDHPRIAKDLNIPVVEWNSLKVRLMESGLLALSNDGFSIIQPELRAQYLQTVDACEAKARTKPTAIAVLNEEFENGTDRHF